MKPVFALYPLSFIPHPFNFSPLSLFLVPRRPVFMVW